MDPVYWSFLRIPKTVGQAVTPGLVFPYKPVDRALVPSPAGKQAAILLWSKTGCSVLLENIADTDTIATAPSLFLEQPLPPVPLAIRQPPPLLLSVVRFTTSFHFTGGSNMVQHDPLPSAQVSSRVGARFAMGTIVALLAWSTRDSPTVCSTSLSQQIYQCIHKYKVEGGYMFCLLCEIDSGRRLLVVIQACHVGQAKWSVLHNPTCSQQPPPPLSSASVCARLIPPGEARRKSWQAWPRGERGRGVGRAGLRGDKYSSEDISKI